MIDRGWGDEAGCGFGRRHYLKPLADGRDMLQPATAFQKIIQRFGNSRRNSSSNQLNRSLRQLVPLIVAPMRGLIVFGTIVVPIDLVLFGWTTCERHNGTNSRRVYQDQTSIRDGRVGLLHYHMHVRCAIAVRFHDTTHPFDGGGTRRELTKHVFNRNWAACVSQSNANRSDLEIPMGARRQERASSRDRGFNSLQLRCCDWYLGPRAWAPLRLPLSFRSSSARRCTVDRRLGVGKLGVGALFLVQQTPTVESRCAGDIGWSTTTSVSEAKLGAGESMTTNRKRD